MTAWQQTSERRSGVDGVADGEWSRINLTPSQTESLDSRSSIIEDFILHRPGQTFFFFFPPSQATPTQAFEFHQPVPNEFPPQSWLPLFLVSGFLPGKRSSPLYFFFWFYCLIFYYFISSLLSLDVGVSPPVSSQPRRSPTLLPRPSSSCG